MLKKNILFLLDVPLVYTMKFVQNQIQISNSRQEFDNENTEINKNKSFYTFK